MATRVNGGGSEAGRRVARNAAVMAAAEIAGKVATLAWTVVAVRELGAEDFGAFSYALAFALLVAVLPSWGFVPLLVQRGSAQPQLLPQLFGHLLVWRSAAGILCFFIAGYLGVQSRPNARSAVVLLIVLAATLVDHLYIELARAVANARQRLAGVSLALTVQRLVTALLGIGALVAGLGLIGLGITYLAGTIIGAVAVTESVRRIGVRASVGGLNPRSLLIITRAATAIAINNIILMALFRIDQIILGALKGDAAVGEYAAGYRLLETILFLSWVVGRAVFPAMSAAPAPSQIRRGMERGTAALAAVYVPVGCVLMVEANQMLDLLYGQRFAPDGASIVRWLAGAPLLFAIGYLGSFSLLALERRWIMLLASSTAAGYNIALNLLLIPQLSGVGAAIATTTSYLVLAGTVLFALAPRIGWVRLDRALFVPAVASAIMVAVLLPLDMGLLVEVPLGGLLYTAVWYALARWRDPEQLALARSMVPWLR